MRRLLIDIKCDGACDNNSKLKLMGIGAAVFVDSTYREDLSACKMVGTNGTNNIAEWEGLVLGFEVAKKLLFSKEFEASRAYISLRLYSDSEIIVKQFNGKYKIKKLHFIPFFSKCQQLRREVWGPFKSVSWIPRDENTHADDLSKKAILDWWKLNT